MLGTPNLLVLDEPTSGVDPESKKLIWNSIVNASRKCPIIVSTHSMEEAEALASKILIMMNGTVDSFGTISELH